MGRGKGVLASKAIRIVMRVRDYECWVLWHAARSAQMWTFYDKVSDCPLIPGRYPQIKITMATFRVGRLNWRNR